MNRNLNDSQPTRRALSTGKYCSEYAYVLKRGAFVHEFETIYTVNFILGMIMITQLIKHRLPYWSKFFGNFSSFFILLTFQFLDVIRMDLTGFKNSEMAIH